VWFWAQKETETELYHVDDSGTVTSYEIGSAPADGLVTSFLTPITVDNGGNVWIGANTTITRFVPSSGAVTSWAMTPPPPTGDGMPHPGISSIAVSPTTGTVAVVSNDSLVTLLDPTGGTFSPAPGSITGVPTSVAYLQDGTLAVGSTSVNGTGGEVERLGPHGASTVADDTEFLMPDGTDVIAAGGQLTRITATSSIPLGNSTGGASSPSQAGFTLDLDAPIALELNGDIVASTGSGLAILNSSGTVTGTLDLPEYDCSNMSDPGNLSSPATAPQRTCAQRAEAVAVDTAGSIFFFTSGPQGTLEELPSTAVQNSSASQP
jgi:hypothetical protein